MMEEWQDTLTPREAQCLRLVLELHTNDAIARELDLSTNTVRNHVKAARDKLGGLGRYDAARRYVSLIAGTADHSRTSPERTIVVPGGLMSTGPAVRPSDGLAETSYREARAEFAHDPTVYEPGRSTLGAPVTGHSTLVRLLAVPAGAALIALLIVATPPMANSFKELARLIVPLFK